MLHGVRDVLFPRSSSLRTLLSSSQNGLITTLKGRSQVHMCGQSTRQIHTLQLQLQQRSFNTNQLTFVKCLHLLTIFQIVAHTRHRVRTRCNSEHSVFIGQMDDVSLNYRTCQSPHVPHCATSTISALASFSTQCVSRRP